MNSKINKRRSRTNLVQIIYSLYFSNDINNIEHYSLLKGVIPDLNNQDLFLEKLLKTFLDNRNLIEYVLNYTLNIEEYKLENHALINKALLTSAITEILVLQNDIPLIINEYVDISKKYSGENDYKKIHVIIGKAFSIIVKNNEDINKFYNKKS